MARQGISPIVIVLIIVGILACSAFVYYQIVSGMAPGEPPDGKTSSPQEPPPPAPPEEPEPELPLLDESDTLIRSLAETLSQHPRLAAWLAPDDLVRRVVASVVNVANDESPNPHLGFLEVEGGFKVEEDHGDLYLDPSSYRRYDQLIEVFTSLDSAASLRLYHRFEPLFDEAYQELGYPAGDFDNALIKAVDRVLATPIPEGKVGVKRRVTNYRFSDPQLEALGPIEKQLLRMGPANARKIKQKLRLVRSALSTED
ncbi:MAG: DUF3014 domain-containing protein [Acidobacteriota bacterium]